MLFINSGLFEKLKVDLSHKLKVSKYHKGLSGDFWSSYNMTHILSFIEIESDCSFRVNTDESGTVHLKIDGPL